MKRKLIILLTVIILMTTLVGCGSKGPEKTVDGFISAVKSLNLEEASKYVSNNLEEDYTETIEGKTEELTLEEFKNIEGFKELESSVKKLTKELSFKIVDTNIGNDTAELILDLTYADASEPLMTSIVELFAEIMGAAFSGEEVDEEESMQNMFGIIVKNLDGYNLITDSTQGVITLDKSSGDWLITEMDENIQNALLLGIIEGFADFSLFD